MAKCKALTGSAVKGLILPSLCGNVFVAMLQHM